MRFAAALLSALVILASPAFAKPTSMPAATPLRPGELDSENGVLRWMNGYRIRHDVAHVPEAIKALSGLGTFKDPGACGAYIGFFAGVIASNPVRVDELISRTVAAIPAEDHWVVVEAIAYSGLPDWKNLLRKFGPRMPTRQIMIEKFLAGKLKTLDQMEFEKDLSFMDRVNGFFDVKKLMPGGDPNRNNETHDASTTVLDALWGYYFATGDTRPILRIVSVLPWSKNRDNADKLTIGATAKLTLASNAVRDSMLLAILRNETKHQPKEVAEVLKDVVDAADTAQTERIRKEALADIDEIKRKGSLSKRETVWWGQAGELTLAGVCVVEAALGNLAFGIPCVIGGGLSAAALTYYSNNQQ
jgi:hypothetical protein